ncbi:MAG: glycosyltransferase family 39 protein [Solirubrobacteraceae bacterium]
MSERRADIATSELVAVGLTAVAALALRVAGMGQSLFGDELFTYADLAGRGVGGVVRHVAGGGVEDNPPLFYVLAELSSRLGAPEVWLRLPSVVLGTLTVPVLWLAGRLVAGPRAGLSAAALWVLSPFVLFYGTEGRAYATLAFFAALSTLALLLALRTGRRRWWALYALATCAALYSHYTAVFVLAAQAVWALAAHRGAWRPLVLATAAAALAYLPWIPSLIEQGRDSSAQVIGAFYPLSLRSFGEGIARPFCCHPYVQAADLPGRDGLALLVAGALVLDAAALRERGGRLTADRVLLVVLALATPAGLLAYSAVGTGIFAPRNLTASIPAACLLAGWLLARLPARAALAAGGLVAAGLLIGLVIGLGPSKQRPDLGAAAAIIDARAGADDSYAETQLFFSDAPELRQGLRLHFDRRHPAVGVTFRREPDNRLRPVADRRAWLAVAAGKRLFVVGPRLPNLVGLPEPPPDLAARVRREQTRRFAGIFAIDVAVWGPRRP